MSRQRPCEESLRPTLSHESVEAKDDTFIPWSVEALNILGHVCDELDRWR